jgi:hypothetical protein
MIRVDALAPVSTDVNGCVPAPAILNALLSGSKVTVRRYEWPYDHSKDFTGPLDGFSDAVELVRHIKKILIGSNLMIEQRSKTGLISEPDLPGHLARYEALRGGDPQRRWRTVCQGTA